MTVSVRNDRPSRRFARRYTTLKPRQYDRRQDTYIPMQVIVFSSQLGAAEYTTTIDDDVGTVQMTGCP
jgi:hypothetical protein